MRTARRPERPARFGSNSSLVKSLKIVCSIGRAKQALPFLECNETHERLLVVVVADDPVPSRSGRRAGTAG